jgi:phage terminase large subunit GpA-like protein
MSNQNFLKKILLIDSTEWQPHFQTTLSTLITRTKSFWLTEKGLSALEWAIKHRVYGIDESQKHGNFDVKTAPWLAGMLACASNPKVREIIVPKAAGVMVSNGFLTNFLGRTITEEPCDIIGVLPNSTLAGDFMEEKIHRMIRNSPIFSSIINLSKKSRGVRKQQLQYPGGKLVIEGAGSTQNIQMRHVPIGFSDEADRCISENRHGSPMQHLADRVQSFDNSKLIFLGTPSGVKSLSFIEEKYNRAHRYKFFVPCHNPSCHEAHALSFDNIIYDDSESNPWHDIYGHVDLTTALYQCPYCLITWSDEQKNDNVILGEWRSVDTGELLDPDKVSGSLGFGGLEAVYSSYDRSSFSELLKDYLIARHEFKSGNQQPMIDFYNTRRGLTYEYKSKTPDIEQLAERAENYAEFTVPPGGLWLTLTVDVQSSGRLSVMITAWGKDLECWIVFWNELLGNITDKNDPVWRQLERIIETPLLHAYYKVPMRIEAVGIDASDGNTAELVYSWVRDNSRRFNVMAIKGASIDNGQREIFTRPAAKDLRGKNHSKAAKMGLQVYQVGTHRAKDRIYSSLNLTSYDEKTGKVITGRGAGRIHFYQDIRADFYKQLLAEIKVPTKNKGKEVYKKKWGQANEALDNLVYNLHAAYSLRLHLKTADQCQKREYELSQTNVFNDLLNTTEKLAWQDTVNNVDAEIFGKTSAIVNESPKIKPPKIPTFNFGSLLD